MTELELRNTKREFNKLVSVDEVSVDGYIKRAGKIAINEFKSSLRLSREDLFNIKLNGLGSGEYSDIKRKVVSKIAYINGLPYIVVDVMTFTFQGNQLPQKYTKSYMRGIGHNFNEYLKTPTSLKVQKRFEVIA